MGYTLLGVYPGTCFGDTQELKVYDWARNKTGDGDAFRRIDYLSNMDVYKISMDDSFGHTQTYLHVLNFTRWSSSLNKWINELFIFNTTPPGSWVRKYYYEYSDYDYISEYGGVSATWSKWAGILEFYSDGGVNPIPLKEVGFKNLFRVFNGNIQPLNSPYLAFRQDTIPSGNSNRNNIHWQDYTTWTAGATTDNN